MQPLIQEWTTLKKLARVERPAGAGSRELARGTHIQLAAADPSSAAADNPHPGS